MARQAVEYVEGLELQDGTARRIFLAIAQRARMAGDSEYPIMGLNLWDSEIPELAAECAMGAQEFRHGMRNLRQQVRMDILEHADGLWEIVFGPSYTTPRRPSRDPLIAPGPIEAFFMPGWEHYSTWGHEADLGYMYAQLIANTDDPDDRPRIWITPPRYVITNVDDLAAAIAEELKAHELVPPPAVLVKAWMKPPL